MLSTRRLLAYHYFLFIYGIQFLWFTSLFRDLRIWTHWRSNSIGWSYGRLMPQQLVEVLEWRNRMVPIRIINDSLNIFNIRIFKLLERRFIILIWIDVYFRSHIVFNTRSFHAGLLPNFFFVLRWSKTSRIRNNLFDTKGLLLPNSIDVSHWRSIMKSLIIRRRKINA